MADGFLDMPALADAVAATQQLLPEELAGWLAHMGEDPSGIAVDAVLVLLLWYAGVFPLLFRHDFSPHAARLLG